MWCSEASSAEQQLAGAVLSSGLFIIHDAVSAHISLKCSPALSESSKCQKQHRVQKSDSCGLTGRPRVAAAEYQKERVSWRRTDELLLAAERWACIIQ